MEGEEEWIDVLLCTGILQWTQKFDFFVNCDVCDGRNLRNILKFFKS